MNDIQITMRLFGAFRRYGENIVFSMPRGATIAKVKQELARALSQADALLLADSAVANDSEILNEGAVLTTDSRLAILPPVCGG